MRCFPFKRQIQIRTVFRWLVVLLGMSFFSAILCLADASGSDYIKGQNAYKASRYGYAIQLFEKDLKQRPENSYSYFYLGLCYAKTNKKVLAKKAFEKVLEIENMKTFSSKGERPNAVLLKKAQKNIAVMTNRQIKATGNTQKAKAIIQTHAGKSDNYLTHALQSNGKVAHWALSKMPLKIYVSSGQGVPGWNSSMNQTVTYAMGVWHRASGKKIKFKLTRNRKEADIVVKWRRSFGHNRVGVNPFESIGGHIVRSDMILATSYPNGKPLGYNEIQGTAIHELGHALGVQGHSPYPEDVMFFSKNPIQGNTLTLRDKKTIQLLYQQKADITNGTNVSPSQTKQVYGLITQGNQELTQNPGRALSYYQKAYRIDPRNKDVAKSMAIARYNLGIQAMNAGVNAAKRQNKAQARVKFQEAVRLFEGLSQSSTAPSGTAQNLKDARRNLQLVSQ